MATTGDTNKQGDTFDSVREHDKQPDTSSDTRHPDTADFAEQGLARIIEVSNTHPPPPKPDK